MNNQQRQLESLLADVKQIIADGPAPTTSLAHTTTKIRIEVDGVIRRQYSTSAPLTLSEVWHHKAIRTLGPTRMARLGSDGVAYVSIDRANFVRSLA